MYVKLQLDNADQLQEAEGTQKAHRMGGRGLTKFSGESRDQS